MEIKTRLRGNSACRVRMYQANFRRSNNVQNNAGVNNGTRSEKMRTYWAGNETTGKILVQFVALDSPWKTIHYSHREWIRTNTAHSSGVLWCWVVHKIYDTSSQVISVIWKRTNGCSVCWTTEKTGMYSFFLKILDSVFRIVTRPRIGRNTVRIPVVEKWFLSLPNVQNDFKTNTASNSVVTAVLSQGKRRPECKVNHTFPSGGKAKYEWGIISVPSLPSRRRHEQIYRLFFFSAYYGKMCDIFYCPLSALSITYSWT
jgi:hypothetical protein